MSSAQTATGSILGDVHDSQRRVVVGAAVTVTNLETRTEQHLQTNQDGIFQVPSLQPGPYTVNILKEGFGSQITTIEVGVAQTASATFTLLPGRVDTEVTVEETSALDLSAPAINSNVERAVLDDVPLPERSTLGLVLLLPGVTVDGYGINSEIPNSSQSVGAPGASLAIGGGRTGTVSQLVDGADITGNGFPRAAITFSARSVKRIAVQTGAMPAQYGRNGGGIVNQVSQNGTSQYHGTAAIRHTDPFFEYTSYAGNNQDNHQNLITFTLSGPVPIKQLRKNTFFFAAYEPTYYSTASTAFERLPTQDELDGRFHDSYDILNQQYVKQYGFAKTLADAALPGMAGLRTGGVYYHNPLQVGGPFDGFPFGAPCTQQVAASANSTGCPNGNAYVQAVGTTASPRILDNPLNLDDISAQAAVNPLSRFIAASFPTPANPGRYAHFFDDSGTPNNLGLNAAVIRAVGGSDKRYSIRVDHDFHNSDRVYARYSYVPIYGNRFTFVGTGNASNPVVTADVHSYNGVVGYTHLFGINKVNELRGAYLLLNDQQVVPAASTDQDYAAKFGLYPALTGRGFPQLTGIGLAGSVTVLGTGGASGTGLQQNFVFGDDLSVLFGRHEVKVGVDFRALQENLIPQAGYGGSYGFSGGLSGRGGGSGSGLASLDLGLINSVSIQGPSPFYYRWKYGAAYVQDTWRILPKVTLNYGLRYNVETPQHEKFGNQGAFVPGLKTTLNGLPVTGAFAYAGQQGLKDTLWPVFYAGLEPRFAIAVQPVPRVVLRAGYALVHVPLSGISSGIHPNLQPSPINSIGGVNGGLTPGYSLDFISNPVAPLTLQPFANLNHSTVLPNFTLAPLVPQTNNVPYIQTWTATVQYAVGKNGAVEVDYVGQRGLHLFSPQQNRNAPPIDFLQRQTAVGETPTGGSFADTSVSPYGIGSISYLNQLNPYPQIANSQLLSTFARDSSSNYNALYVSGRGRLPLNFTLQSAFSWSKSLDNASFGLADSSTGSFGYVGSQAPYNLNDEYSVSLFDIPINLSAAYSWDLPIGRQQKFLGNSKGLVNGLIGGFKTSGIFRAADGGPLYILLGGSGYFQATKPTSSLSANSGRFGGNGSTLPAGFNLRPDRVPGVPVLKKGYRIDPSRSTPYINGAAFSVPGSLDHPRLGNAPRTLSDARAPVQVFFDASLRKEVPFEVGPSPLQRRVAVGPPERFEPYQPGVQWWRSVPYFESGFLRDGGGKHPHLVCPRSWMLEFRRGLDRDRCKRGRYFNRSFRFDAEHLSRTEHVYWSCLHVLISSFRRVSQHGSGSFQEREEGSELIVSCFPAPRQACFSDLATTLSS